MISLFGRRKGECNDFKDALSEVASAATIQELLADASPQQRAHATACDDCRKALEELLATRLLLSALPPQGHVPRPWFASRVMSVIAARGSESSRLATAWTVVPKLASRLAWASAVAILVASTWLYQKPVTSMGQSGADPSAETLFETPSQQTNQDDVLVSMVEKNQ
jgi:hypothetical protein